MERDEVETARRLRRDQTDAESRLWQQLRDRRLQGWKFRRQVPVGRYFADFVCIEARLVVELDGSQHGETRADYDRLRTESLNAAGFRVMRFWNNDVFENLDGVMTAILAACEEEPSPRPSPAGGRGRGAHRP